MKTFNEEDYDFEITSVNIYDEEEILQDVEYTYVDEDGIHYIPHATVQIWRNSITGAESVGWWAIGNEPAKLTPQENEMEDADEDVLS